jgi:release factor glutamine methyltransferase
LIFARQKLAESPSARFDAELLLAFALDSTRSFLYANPEFELPYNRSERFKKLVRKRALGQPIAYLTGSSEFWSLPLEVNRHVLIPRPETELLVEKALSKVPEEADWRIADLGTGSGAIALALASERKNCEVHATDISQAAIRIASENARRLGLERIQFHRGSWNRPLKGMFHLVVSNPPYVDESDPHLSRGDLRFEPRTALTPGPDGLEAIRTIANDVFPIIQDGGWLMFEHGWEQGPACRVILQESGYERVETFKDLQGHERVTIGQKAGRQRGG